MQFLLVDDNQPNLKLLNAFLKKAAPDCTTTLVDNIPEALFQAFTKPWDAIFLDIMMPQYNGNDFLRICERLVNAKQLPESLRIVVVTAIASHEELQSYTTIPFVSAVIRKPVRYEDIQNSLRLIPQTA